MKIQTLRFTYEFWKKKSFVLFENYSNSWVPMIDKDFINDSFIPEKPGQLLKEMKNDYVKGGLISISIWLHPQERCGNTILNFITFGYKVWAR